MHSVGWDLSFFSIFVFLDGLLDFGVLARATCNHN
jgi:hypothetical protein